MRCDAVNCDRSIKSSKLCDELKFAILESNCGQRNKTKAAVPITRQQDKKREKGRAELCSTALFGHESYRINHQKGLVMDGRSPREE